MALKLDITYEFNFDLIGIVCPERSFKLAWQLNQLLGIDLTRQEDIELAYLEGSILKIANFQYHTENDMYQLLKNKAHWSLHSTKPFLLPELKEYDYFLMIDNVTQMIDVERIKDSLSQLTMIQYCLSIDLEQVKDRENLLF
ncbi:MAG: IPExxxVDY family protein [Flammeovirgaceae bacterium]